MNRSSLPYRGIFGASRPASLSSLALPPAPMPPRQGLRPLKAWRYVGVYSPELMLCAGSVRIGPARQAFWAIWDRPGRRLLEHTVRGRSESVRLERGRLTIREGSDIEVDLALDETAGIETVCSSGASYAWTRKQGGIRAHGTVHLDGEERHLDARAIVDDTAAYYERHIHWRWCAGVGLARDGRRLAWNLVSGVNDPLAASERTVWVDDEPSEVPPNTFAADLSSVDELRFDAEAARERRENLLVVRSAYRQPFGTFSGSLPGGIELAEGYGVMEDHEVYW
jgi:hypothetical protein